MNTSIKSALLSRDVSPIVNINSDHKYGKCSKISNIFQFLFSNKLNVGFRAGIHKMLVKIANRENPDQTASSEAV